MIHPSAIVSPHARIYGNVDIGEHSRIDDGVILTGDIKIGAYCHIAAYAVLTGRAGITIGDYVGISMFSVLLTGSDDFSGRSMVGPTVPEKYKPFLQKGPISIGRNCIIGAHSTIMPNVKIGNGVSVGAYSLVKGDCEDDSIYAGRPAQFMKTRSLASWELVKRLENELV